MLIVRSIDQNLAEFNLRERRLHTYYFVTDEINNDFLQDIIEANSDEVNIYYFNFSITFKRSNDEYQAPRSN